MARPRTPTAVLELTGAFQKDPQRRECREGEPAANGPLGDPPAGFAADRELLEIWDELVSLVPANVLARADRWTVELACRMMRLLRKGGFKAAELNILLSCLSRMGLTPADRSKVSIPKPSEEIDELAALAAEGKAGRLQ